jgi:hypothetical protein
LPAVARADRGNSRRERLADRARLEVPFGDNDWGGVFDALKDASYFAQAALDEEMGTTVWPNGADIALETLHHWASQGP